MLQPLRVSKKNDNSSLDAEHNDNTNNREIKAHKQLLVSPALKCGQLESAMFVKNNDNKEEAANREIKAHKQPLTPPTLTGGQLESTILPSRISYKKRGMLFQQKEQTPINIPPLSKVNIVI